MARARARVIVNGKIQAEKEWKNRLKTVVKRKMGIFIDCCVSIPYADISMVDRSNRYLRGEGKRW